MRRFVVLVAAIAIAACSGGSKQEASGTRRLRFAVIPKSLDIPVFNYARIGAERKARQLGDVDILWNAPTNADQLKQKEILESYITQRVDGIAISALNGDFLTDTINRAIAAGIPVVTWDSSGNRAVDRVGEEVAVQRRYRDAVDALRDIRLQDFLLFELVGIRFGIPTGCRRHPSCRAPSARLQSWRN